MNDYKNNYEGHFQAWELKVAKKLVKDFLNEHKKETSHDDFNDLLQECLSHWSSVRDQYDPAERAAPNTFMGIILRHKLGQIRREMESDKRKVSHQTISLNEFIQDEDDSDTYLEQLADYENEDYGNAENEICLKLDLAKVLNQLSPKQKKLCKYLGEEGLPVQEISKKLQMPRGTVYEEIKRVKKNFCNNGLEEYFKKK